jgi:hypothetical protein
MANDGEAIPRRRGMPWRLIAWGFAALLLLLPLAAMQFDSGVDWTLSDFIFAAVLIGGVALAFELAVLMSRSVPYRAGAGLALLAAFLIVWANGAVGMIGSEDNPFNLLFAGAILLALVGALAARFRAAGMALVMTGAAIVHMAVAVAGMASDPRGGMVSLVFAAPWLLSAALFRKAARERRA